MTNNKKINVCLLYTDDEKGDMPLGRLYLNNKKERVQAILDKHFNPEDADDDDLYDLYFYPVCTIDELYREGLSISYESFENEGSVNTYTGKEEIGSNWVINTYGFPCQTRSTFSTDINANFYNSFRNIIRPCLEDVVMNEFNIDKDNVFDISKALESYFSTYLNFTVKLFEYLFDRYACFDIYPNGDIVIEVPMYENYDINNLCDFEEDKRSIIPKDVYFFVEGGLQTVKDEARRYANLSDDQFVLFNKIISTLNEGPFNALNAISLGLIDAYLRCDYEGTNNDFYIRVFPYRLDFKKTLFPEYYNFEICYEEFEDYQTTAYWKKYNPMELSDKLVKSVYKR